MKAPRTSCEGYLTLRTSPSSPPPMLRRYCFLVGTSLYYYSTQEDAYHMQRLKGEVQVLGVQDWDGKGNMHIYQNGFLFATAQNKVFYAYADTAMEKEKWMRAIQMTVETTMTRAVSFEHYRNSLQCTQLLCVKGCNGFSEGNSSASGSGTPKKLICGFSEAQGSPISNSAISDSDAKCRCHYCQLEQVNHASTTPAASSILYKCYNCEELWCEKFTSNKIPLPHRSFYYSKRVCDDCHNAQVYLNYLKATLERLKAGICIYPKPLSSDTPIELIMPKRPMHTEAANIAINMLKVGLINAEECEEILLGDRRYLKNTSEHPEIPLDLKILALHREFRSRGFSVYRAVILLHRHLDSDPLLFKPIVEKLLHFSYTRINQVEFYWPQIVHAYLTVPMFDFEKLFWLDELIISICSRSIHLALLLRWQLQGALEDAFDITASKDMQDKYPRVVRLMVEMEKEVVGVKRIRLAQEDASMRSFKSRLPLPTEEQLVLIESLTEGIMQKRKEAHENIPSRRSKSLDFGRPLSCGSRPASLSIKEEAPASTNSTTAITSENENRFRDFSKFQQHLLTPRDDPSLDIILGTSFLGHEIVDELPPSSLIEEDMVDNQPTTIFGTESFRRMSHSEQSVLGQYFADECNFVEQVTDIAEELRLVSSIPERKRLLPMFLDKIKIPPIAYVPLVKATDPFERIVRIPRNEGTAFSTKARVPIMLIFEVIRGNLFSNSAVFSPISPRPSTPSGMPVNDYPDEEEVDRFMQRESESQESVKDENCKLHEERVMLEGIKLDVPETPSIVDGSLETPCTLTKLGMEMETEAFNALGHAATLSEEVLEREKDRRSDLEAAFGESWSSKRRRLSVESPFGHVTGWDIVSMIGKSNDDLRQEVFSLQLIQKFIEIFKIAKVPIWLKSYRIIATSSSTGLIETLTDAISLDGLKKREGYTSLLHHFEKSYGNVTSSRFLQARKNFIESLAGYSIVCYLLQIKDRHNGNIMLDNEGHLIHIDYGFLLGIAPGGSFSIETAPFKLTAEMVETMGGSDSEGFKEYITLCTRGFLACQQHSDEICDLVDIMSRQSSYPCFVGKDVSYILFKLRSRFKLGASKHDVVAHVLSLIRKSNSNYSTRQYDNFQRMTNGILP
uniref:1-phosphatidylinositol 4-kinase n=1 Tax=Albugo laibachii Nc14 TaxID=890382 RepID=F0WM94_9STRA|nr:phosphatidyl inositol kinase (PIKG1) putative [Albugo laibachii Nc14]|eukprot:CCA22424.1 phosphatidyl inositol kinase (PIKG1) putative [Albugo laibachii Nc14]